MRLTLYPTLAENLWPAEVASAKLLRPAVTAILGALALAASAKLQVPFYPVPMTMQTLVVLVLGAVCGLRMATATVALYLLEGLAGLPVFASGAGLAYAAGPTGGFLAGFLFAAAFVGYAAQRGFDRSILGSLIIMSLGHVIIFICGFAWLAGLIGLAKAWSFGVAPFFAATVLKTVLATAVVRALWTLNTGPRR